MKPKESRIVLAVIVAAAILTGLVCCRDAKAQPLTYYIVTFRFDRGYDQPTIDSAFAVFTDGSSGANDSGLRVTYDTLRYAGRKDSLTFTVSIAAAAISKSINPSVMLCVFPSNRRTLQPAYICETKEITHMIHSVDTARQSPNVLLILDSASLANLTDSIISAINAGLGGSGDYPETLIVVDTAQDALVQGARVFVYQTDTSCCQNGSGGQVSDLSGRLIYSLDAGTFPVAVSSQGFFQQSAYQLVTQAGPGGLDTVKLYSFTPNVATGADSCNLIIYTDVPYSRAEISMHGAGQGMEAKPVRDTSGVWLDRGRIIPNPLADANGIIVVPVARYNATVPKAVYDIKILNERGHDLATFDNYKIPDSATHVLRVTP